MKLQDLGMTFTDAEIAYLSSQRLGRLATIAPDGFPQNNPVGFWVNKELGTIDIGGAGPGGSRKVRRIPANPQVALVVGGPLPTPPPRGGGVGDPGGGARARPPPPAAPRPP